MNMSLVSDEMKQAGYATAMVGKWHVGCAAWEQTPIYRGFDTFYGFIANGQMDFLSKKNDNYYDLYKDADYETDSSALSQDVRASWLYCGAHLDATRAPCTLYWNIFFSFSSIWLWLLTLSMLTVFTDLFSEFIYMMKLAICNTPPRIPPCGCKYCSVVFWNGFGCLKLTVLSIRVVRYDAHAEDFIRQQTNDKPWFLYYAFQDPHTPLSSPEYFLEQEPCASMTDSTRQVSSVNVYSCAKVIACIVPFFWVCLLWASVYSCWKGFFGVLFVTWLSEWRNIIILMWCRCIVVWCAVSTRRWKVWWQPYQRQASSTTPSSSLQETMVVHQRTGDTIGRFVGQKERFLRAASGRQRLLGVCLTSHILSY